MIRIIQCICHNRHAIVAFAYETSGTAPVEQMERDLRNTVAKLISNAGMRPWCGICKSPDFRYEDAATRFETMEQALPALMIAQALNQHAARVARASNN